MISSTLGFIYTSDFSQVLLITKQRPIFQKGKLNGLGGKCEGKESLNECISREVEEESGLRIGPTEWKRVGSLNWTEWQVEIFAASYTGSLDDAQSLTEDKVAWYNTTNLPSNIISNLSWLVPLGIDILKQEKSPTVKVEYPS